MIRKSMILPDPIIFSRPLRVWLGIITISLMLLQMSIGLRILKKFQDWDLWLTMLEKGYQGFHLPKVLFTAIPQKQGITS